MISLNHPGLIFAGLVQPIGPTIPLVEIQGKWIAAVLSGELKLPPPSVRKQEVDAHRRMQQQTYLDSKRYILEVDYRTYAQQMHADIRTGHAGDR